MIQAAVTHRAGFRFDRAWVPSLLHFRLSPRPGAHGVRSSTIELKPSPHRLDQMEDVSGNAVTSVRYSRKISELNVATDLVLNLENPLDVPAPFSDLSEEESLFNYALEPTPPADLSPYLEFETIVSEDVRGSLQDLSGPLDSRSAGPDFLLKCAALVRKVLQPVHRMNASLRDPVIVLSRGMASSAEASQVLLLLLRQFGFATRFVSGYVVHLDAESLGGSDSAELRSWVDVYHPLLGWVGLDPVIASWTGAGSIPLAVGANPEGAAPYPPALLGDGTEFSEYLTVQRFREAGTEPYDSIEMKSRVDGIIDEAERRLRRAGLRFHTASVLRLEVSDSRERSRYGDALKDPAGNFLRGFRERAGHGALPVTLYGDPSSSLVFREDGEPLWKDERFLIEAGGQSERPLSSDLAHRLMEAIAGKLKIDPTFIIEGFEDPLWHMMFEGELPPELDTDLPDVREGRERRRLMALLDSGLQNSAGFALPLGFDVYSNRWNSCSWKFRRGRLFLLPGTDPMGVRLPLRSISDHFARAPVSDPFYRKAPLSEAVKHLYNQEMVYTPVHQAHPIETALCVQVLANQVHVFLPAIDRAEAWIDLVGIIERCAAKLDLPVLLEAIGVPVDHRLRLTRTRSLDGGRSLEIELPFSGGPEETAGRMGQVFAEIDRIRSVSASEGSTENFVLSQHRLILGNAVPAESPFFARPNLLARFIRFWQGHPALTLLLSASEFGPSSDTFLPGETGALLSEELELGLRSLENGHPAPWEVDRALRLGLSSADSRSVPWLSVASLFDPETYQGRRGAVEFQSLAAPASMLEWRIQIALFLSILAMLVDDDLSASPSGDDLYDRALLPYFVLLDVEEVFSSLRSRGFSFPAVAVRALFLRRFPLVGECVCDGIAVEVRQAVEPVLSRSGTQTERVQILMRGWNSDRYQLTCNGALLPLHPTEMAGEYVGAVRYAPRRAAPEGPFSLQFDIYDPWNRRSAGGFLFLPETKKFEAQTHSAGRLAEPAHIKNDHHPLTTDLRFLRT